MHDVASLLLNGLRDYGTGTWEGGDEGCDHVVPLGRDGPPKGTAGGDAFRTGQSYTHQKVTGNVCKCGARRIDRQIGLEESPSCGGHGLMRLRSDLTPDQRAFVAQRLLGVGLSDA